MPKTSSKRRLRGVTLRITTAILSLTAMTRALPAETLADAMIRAYHNNPDIQQQRAGVRAKDELVPQARSIQRPKINVTADAGRSTDAIYQTPGLLNKARTYSETTPRQGAAVISQPIWDGGKGRSSISQAEATVLQAREQLRQTEENLFYQTAKVYMDVLRDSANLRLRDVNVKMLMQQLADTKLRYDNKEVTETDLNQSQSALSTGRYEYYVAQSALAASVAAYQQTVGVIPKKLDPVKINPAMIPKSTNDAIAKAFNVHPAVLGALYQQDAAKYGVGVAESALSPTLDVRGTIYNQYDYYNSSPYRNNNAMIQGVLNIPIYQGGGEYASIRQAKEQYSQARLVVDQQRLAVRAAILTAWSAVETTHQSIGVLKNAVDAAEAALVGVREEAKIGQRTTNDILNAQQTLLIARTNLIDAEHDYILANYALLQAQGTLDAKGLKLDTQLYDPSIHFNDVDYSWLGTGPALGRGQ